MKLFLDANVIFAAAATPKGRVQALFEFAALGACELFGSAYVIEEARRNITAKLPGALPRFNERLGQLSVVADVSPALASEVDAQLPAKDAPVLAAAIAAKVELLVTGDRRHFGPLYRQMIQGVLVLPPSEAWDYLLEALN